MTHVKMVYILPSIYRLKLIREDTWHRVINILFERTKHIGQ